MKRIVLAHAIVAAGFTDRHLQLFDQACFADTRRAGDGEDFTGACFDFFEDR